MSLYNALFGTNKIAPVLLKMLNVTTDYFGRFRDCYLESDGEKIVVYTRTGGGNRESYEETWGAVRAHPNYIRDYDDDFDCTYAYAEFSVPDVYKEDCKMLTIMAGSDKSPSEKFQQLIQDLENGVVNKETEKAAEVGEKIFSEVDKKANEDGGIISI